MSFQSQLTATHQTIPPIAPIDTTPIVEHGESPTAIILAVAILIGILLGSLTGVIRAVVPLIVQHTKSSQ
ncbi:MAG TPA: hypothetical protein V6D26_15865 [Stenomitos sp.]